MMEPMASCVPPGFRFHPNEEELVGYYLKKKVASQKIDLDVIREVDLYRIEPWDIQERCKMGYEEQNEWYFFSHKDKKYPTGTRTNRATIAGFWKATGRDKAVYDKTKLIGMRKTLVFYKGRAPNGQKSDWIMHEYRLESDENGPPQEEGWVVCRAFKKKTNVNMGSNCINKAADQGWDSSTSNNYNFYEETSGLSSSSDHHHHFHPRNPPTFLPPPPSSSSSPSHGFLCKQELLDHNTTMINNHGHNMMMTRNLNNILLINSEMHPFLQLPQLESPSILPLSKSSVSILSDQPNNDDKGESGEIIEHINKGHSSSNPVAAEKVMDWRSLDKFVASQLSHDNDKGDHHNDQGAVFGGHDNDHGLLDMALILLQNSGKDEGGGGEGDKFIDGLLATSSESDLGILQI